MFRAFGTSLSFSVIGSVIGGGTLILVIAVLQPNMWGESAAILGIGQFLGSVASFGSHINRIRTYSQLASDDISSEARIDLVSRMSVGVAVAILALGALWVWPALGAVLIASAGVFVSLGVSNHFIAQKRYARAGWLLIFEKCLALSAIGIALAAGGLSAVALPLAIGGAGLGVGLLTIALLRPDRHSIFKGLRFDRIADTWRGSFFLGIASIAPSALLLDVTIVWAVSNSHEAGLFAVATKLTAPLSVAATAVVAVLLPYLASSTSRTLPRTGRKGVIALIAFLVGLTVVFVTANIWVPLVFGNQYLGAVWPVRFYVLNVSLILVTRALLTVLQAWNDERMGAFLVLGQVCLALVGLAIGGMLGNAIGASVAVLATNAILAVLLWRRVGKVSRQPKAEDCA